MHESGVGREDKSLAILDTLTKQQYNVLLVEILLFGNDAIHLNNSKQNSATIGSSLTHDHQIKMLIFYVGVMEISRVHIAYSH